MNCSINPATAHQPRVRGIDDCLDLLVIVFTPPRLRALDQKGTFFVPFLTTLSCAFYDPIEWVAILQRFTREMYPPGIRLGHLLAQISRCRSRILNKLGRLQ